MVVRSAEDTEGVWWDPGNKALSSYQVKVKWLFLDLREFPEMA